MSNDVSQSIDSGTVIQEVPDEEQCRSISGVLSYCKKKVLFPYLRLLGVVGLKPWCEDSLSESQTCLLCCNKAYVLSVGLLVFTGYLLQFLTCFRRDCGYDYVISNATGQWFGATLQGEAPGYFFPLQDDQNNRSNVSSISISKNFGGQTFNGQAVPHYACNGNLFYIHALPTLFHASAFLYMIFLYWFRRDEQLQNLMERVFIQANYAHLIHHSQRKVTRNLRNLALFASCWILLSTINLVVPIFTNEIHVNYVPTMPHNYRQGVAAAMCFATFWQDAIQITVVSSYCIHCNLLSMYFGFIHARVSQHTITLSDCIKEIGEMEKLLAYVNMELAPGLLPLLILDAVYFVGSLKHLLRHRDHFDFLPYAIQTTRCVQWIIIIILALIFASYLSQKLKKVRRLGHLVRTRPFGYQEYKQEDLDSFLLFVSTLKLDVRILRIPLSATNIFVVTVAVIVIFFVWGYFG